MKLNYEMIEREIAGETILVPIGAAAMKYNGMMTLNETAALIWRNLPKAESAADLVAALRSEYDVSEEEARADVHELLSQLAEMGIISLEDAK